MNLALSAILLFLLLKETTCDRWIDPHDMNLNEKELKFLNSLDSETGTVNKFKPQYNVKDQHEFKKNLSLMYLKRVINLIINSALVDPYDNKLMRGQFVIDIEHENYKFLKDFTNKQDIDEHTFRHLDDVLSELFHKTAADKLHDFFISTQERFFLWLFSENGLIFCSTLFAMYIMYCLFRGMFSFWYILRYFIMVILIIDYGVKYKHLLEQTEAHNLKVLSPKCREQSWFGAFFTSKNECDKKFVTPLDVLSLQIEKLIIVPISSLGTGFGLFAEQLWGSLSYPWNVLIFPIMLIFVLLLATTVLTIMTGFSIRVNLMHLFKLDFGPREKSTQNVIYEKLFDAVSEKIRQITNGSGKETVVPESKSKTKKRKASGKCGDCNEKSHIEEVSDSDDGSKRDLSGEGQSESSAGASNIKETSYKEHNAQSGEIEEDKDKLCIKCQNDKDSSLSDKENLSDAQKQRLCLNELLLH